MKRFHLVEVCDGTQTIIETSEAEFIPGEGSTIVIINSSRASGGERHVRYNVLEVKHVLDKRFDFRNNWVTEVFVEKIS